jgi:hypothetical protein
MAIAKKNMAVGGGIIMLVLWGGLGLFIGTSSKKDHKAKDREVQKMQDREQKTEDRIITSAVEKQPSALAPNTDGKDTSTPNLSKHAFSYVLRLRYIHPVLPNGEIAKQTISLEELIERGKQAKQDKQELHLRVKGDARAKWEKEVKTKLGEAGLIFSITNEF